MLLGGFYNSKPAFTFTNPYTFSQNPLYLINPGIVSGYYIETVQWIDNSNFTLQMTTNDGLLGWNFDYIIMRDFSQQYWTIFINKTVNAVPILNKNIDSSPTGLIAVSSDFTTSPYMLLYKIDPVTGLVTNHKKVNYHTSRILWN